MDGSLYRLQTIPFGGLDRATGVEPGPGLPGEALQSEPGEAVLVAEPIDVEPVDPDAQVLFFGLPSLLVVIGVSSARQAPGAAPFATVPLRIRLWSVRLRQVSGIAAVFCFAKNFLDIHQTDVGTFVTTWIVWGIFRFARSEEGTMKKKGRGLGFLVAITVFLAACGGGGYEGPENRPDGAQGEGLLTDGGKDVLIDFGNVPYGCKADEECDDGIDCTVDSCIGGECKNIPDNKRCGAGEVCQPAKGGCEKAKSCFSDSQCTDILKCTVEGCDQTTHLCQQIFDDSRCPKGYICFAPPGKDYWTDGNTDEFSGCLPTSRCKSDGDCVAPSGSCAVGKCVGGICVYQGDHDVCDDGNVCNGQESCVPSDDCRFYGCDYGVCFFPEYCNRWSCSSSSEPQVNCDDHNPCTDDWCDPKKGCVHVNNSAPCEDGQICTAGDHCEDGVCVSGGPLDCDDHNPCTEDLCVPGELSHCPGSDTEYCPRDLYLGDGVTMGCQHLPSAELEGKPCDLPCLVGGFCHNGQCEGGVEKDCDDGNPCTADYCDPIEGCTHQDLGAIEITCGVGECQAHGQCVGGIPQCEPKKPSVEICNGKDDDCDGLTDEDLGTTTCGLGVCNHTVQNCVDGQPQSCDPLQGATPETCNGKDDDCDGLTDEDLGSTTCGLGICRHTVQNCVDGVPQICNPLEGAQPEVLNNGLDDDCDGVTDQEGSCKWFYACVSACPPLPQGQACIQACQGKLTPQGMQDVQNLQNCLQQYGCFYKQTDEEFTKCLEDFCIEPYFRCFSGNFYKSCADLIDCLVACPEDNPTTPNVNEEQECIGNCWSEATFDAQMDLHNLIKCANNACASQCQDPNAPACDACWNQVLGPGGVCESYNDKCTEYGPEGCYYLLTCLNGCQADDQQCQQNCVKQTSKNGIALYNAIYDCIMQACPICQTKPNDPQCDTCFTQVQQQGGACYDELQTCLNDRPYGTKKCGEVFQCVNNCSQDQKCAQDCLMSGTKTANDLFEAMNTCALNACPSCNTNPPGADCDTCMNQALSDPAKCKSQYDACMADQGAK